MGAAAARSSTANPTYQPVLSSDGSVLGVNSLWLPWTASWLSWTTSWAWAWPRTTSWQHPGYPGGYPGYDYPPPNPYNYYGGAPPPPPPAAPPPVHRQDPNE